MQMVDRFLELYDTMAAPTGKWVQSSDRNVPPSLPHEGAQKAISDKVKTLKALTPAEYAPWWLPMVCNARPEFQSCLLSFVDTDAEDIQHEDVYVLLHICQRPDSVRFLKATLFDHDEVRTDFDSACALSMQEPVFESVWELDNSELGWSSPMLSAADDGKLLIYVFPHFVFAGDFVCTRCKPMPLDEFAMNLQKHATATRTMGAR